jgi:hypothetical protein
MGIERKVTFEGDIPSIEQVKDVLANAGLKLAMRMIDGQLAFPDEWPTSPWSEIRVAIHKDMVTLRRDGTSVSVVTWGNADETMLRLRDALLFGLAKAGSGIIEGDEETWSADEYQAGHPLN